MIKSSMTLNEKSSPRSLILMVNCDQPVATSVATISPDRDRGDIDESSAEQALCAENIPITGKLPVRVQVVRSFGIVLF